MFFPFSYCNYLSIWNPKHSDENNDLKGQLSDLNRRFHELEIEYRRLENEREELAAAYKESEAVNYFNFSPLIYWLIDRCISIRIDRRVCGRNRELGIESSWILYYEL